MIEKTKDVLIKGRDGTERKFQIQLVKADVGHWIMQQFGGRKFQEEETYDKIRNYLFNLVSVYDHEIPKRVFADGQWLAKELDLEYDLEAVDEIFTQAFDFNFGEFLKKKQEKTAAAIALASAEQALHRPALVKSITR